MIAIGWLWVAFMMAIAEKSAVAGVMTFVFYGLAPCAVLLYLLNKQAGRRRLHQARMRERENAEHPPGEPAPASGDGAEHGKENGAADGAEHDANDGTESATKALPPASRA
jgi:hypothetical protein